MIVALAILALFVYGSWKLSPTAGIIATTLATGVLVIAGLAWIAWRIALHRNRKALRGMATQERVARRERERAMNGVGR